MKIIFLLLISFSFGQLCKNQVSYNKETQITKQENENTFDFCIRKNFNERDTIYVEMHYKSIGTCYLIPFIYADILEQGDDDIENSFFYLNSGPSNKGSGCFYKFSSTLQDDASIIFFSTSPLNSENNILFVKIYMKSSNLWIIILCVCLGVVVIGVAIGLFIYFYKKRKSKSTINEPLSPVVEPVFKPSIENSQN